MTDEGWSIDDEDNSLPAPALPTRASRLWWATTGLILGAGTILIAFGWIGVILLGSAVVTGTIAARRHSWGTSAPGWVAFGAPPAIILAWAALTERGCPDPGKFYILDEGDSPVNCAQIVASYGSMAMFFAFVAIIGAFVPVFVRRQRQLALAERQES